MCDVFSLNSFEVKLLLLLLENSENSFCWIYLINYLSGFKIPVFVNCVSIIPKLELKYSSVKLEMYVKKLVEVLIQPFSQNQRTK